MRNRRKILEKIGGTCNTLFVPDLLTKPGHWKKYQSSRCIFGALEMDSYFPIR